MSVNTFFLLISKVPQSVKSDVDDCGPRIIRSTQKTTSTISHHVKKRRSSAVSSRGHKTHAGEISLADLQHAFEAHVENALRVFDHFTVYAHGTLFKLATGF